MSKTQKYSIYSHVKLREAANLHIWEPVTREYSTSRITIYSKLLQIDFLSVNILTNQLRPQVFVFPQSFVL